MVWGCIYQLTWNGDMSISQHGMKTCLTASMEWGHDINDIIYVVYIINALTSHLRLALKALRRIVLMRVLFSNCMEREYTRDQYN